MVSAWVLEGCPVLRVTESLQIGSRGLLAAQLHLCVSYRKGPRKGPAGNSGQQLPFHPHLKGWLRVHLCLTRANLCVWSTSTLAFLYK